VLDTEKFRFIIYIWYEGGRHMPSLVKLEWKARAHLSAARGVPRGDERRHRVSVPGGSHGDARERLRSNPNMKGGITNMAKKAKGGKKKAGKKR
jgi:hypothetical protein